MMLGGAELKELLVKPEDLYLLSILQKQTFGVQTMKLAGVLPKWGQENLALLVNVSAEWYIANIKHWTLKEKN